MITAVISPRPGPTCGTPRPRSASSTGACWRSGSQRPAETVARLLVTANEARARLTTAAAASTSLSQLHRYEPRLTAANQPVEEAVRVIRSQLGLPPPETS